MTRYVVLLRGVNVGKNNRVPMAEFRATLEALGLSDVKTLLNSGNACFSATQGTSQLLAERIAAAVVQKFGVTTPVVVKSAQEFDAAVRGNPMVPDEAEYARFLVAFAMEPEKLEALTPLQAKILPGERLVVTPQAAYLHCASGILESKVASAMVGAAGRAVTSRNWGTVLKLSALLDASGP